ncbi:unnamed protein product [Nezara viridula]|uniref:Uncharacterized protein n=1 Tax=Nezara viridula TaxID=85310 RepID=A0A9P0H6D5_NEZVI|nr:unnamed protein product [Nezara viridula]
MPGSDTPTHPPRSSSLTPADSQSPRPSCLTGAKEAVNTFDGLGREWAMSTATQHTLWQVCEFSCTDLTQPLPAEPHQYPLPFQRRISTAIFFKPTPRSALV